MKKKIISLITLLACTSLVVACNEETSDDSRSGYNYADASNNPGGGSTSDGEQNVNKEALDKMIADFVSDTGVTVPSTASYNIQDYDVLYYYAYEIYFIYAEVEDPNNAIADAYAATFTADTNLSNLNDEDYPVEDYGYYYADATQNIFINFFSDDNDFVLTIYRYDGLAGTLDVSNVDTSWYVDYVNFAGYEVVDTSIVSLIPNYLEIEGEVNIPNPTAPYIAAFIPSHTDEDGYFVPVSFSIVLEGDQLVEYAAILEQAGYTVDLVENVGTTIDWDAMELVDYTYYTVSAIDANQTVYISIQLDESENTAISIFNFNDLFTNEKTDQTDWTDAEKELMNSTLHQVLPFMAFGGDYLLMDQSDDEWTYLVLIDSYYEDLSEDYIALLLENGFTIDDYTWEDTCYVYDNGQAYIEIFVDYDGGNYLEIYFEESRKIDAGETPEGDFAHTLTGGFFGIKAGETAYDTYKKGVEGVVYEAQASAGSNADGGKGLQIRSKNSNSGVIAHSDDRTCKYITFTFDANTQAGRKIDIYASNTPFTIGQMYGSTATKVGTINYDSSNLTQTYTFTTEYAYVGFRSGDGAVYLKNVVMGW